MRRNISGTFLNYPAELQTDCLLFYARHVEDCLRFMILYWTAVKWERISGGPVSEYFPRFLQMTCHLYEQLAYHVPTKNISDMKIEDAFHHYAIYMKYIIPFIMQGNVEKEVYSLVDKEFTKIASASWTPA